jgi:uncharacterized membrane protein
MHQPIYLLFLFFLSFLVNLWADGSSRWIALFALFSLFASFAFQKPRAKAPDSLAK